MQKREKCLICGIRPVAREGKGAKRFWCAQCTETIERERTGRRHPVWRYVTYRGTVVACYQNGGGKLEIETSKRSPDKLPKGKLIDLDHYVPGFTRPEIKRLKRLVLSHAIRARK